MDEEDAPWKFRPGEARYRPQLHTAANNQWFASTSHMNSAPVSSWADSRPNTHTSQSGPAWPMAGSGGATIQRWLQPAPVTTTTAATEPMEEFADEGDVEHANDSEPACAFVSRIDAGEYERQKREYTKSAVSALLASPEYQRQHTTCHLCWSVWSEGQWRPDCEECGGAAMTRTCAICDGRCPSLWTRDIDLSHSQNAGHWDGECLLPEEQRCAHLTAKLLAASAATDQDIQQGLADLSTHAD